VHDTQHSEGLRRSAGVETGRSDDFPSKWIAEGLPGPNRRSDQPRPSFTQTRAAPRRDFRNTVSAILRQAPRSLGPAPDFGGVGYFDFSPSGALLAAGGNNVTGRLISSMDFTFPLRSAMPTAMEPHASASPIAPIPKRFPRTPSSSRATNKPIPKPSNVYASRRPIAAIVCSRCALCNASHTAFEFRATLKAFGIPRRRAYRRIGLGSCPIFPLAKE
jgi:hypothetical protein